ncbi:uncharacterized protein BO88DRAFT_416308 [Aspergillus vadensis CBS 113365]|uniref:C2H2-type domain-containing protein n=1 Tax=Aspergillus vadensis (strain CBS 113365 / IMI 142717 / IBT 24658) TaxID=1448311 RepID=A0A319B803_ASPVC|nr:hypothetical protein BO88DRAFT_416308 [Aspergillus vadensis CBS 113365]PYH67944.1 hypothetical protein BO88DRAFT_416308 [Aspergillus vadensis CBS 113365]
MDGREISHIVGVNHGESVERRSPIASPDSTRTCTAALAGGVPTSTDVMIGLDLIEQNPNEPQLMNTNVLSDVYGSPIPAAQLNTSVPAAEPGHTNFGVTPQLHAHHLAQHSFNPASQYRQAFPEAKMLNGGVCQCKESKLLKMLRDPEPAYERHCFREEIEARHGGIRPDDLLLTSPPPREYRCILMTCDRVFDDGDELNDHFQLDHNYPDNCVCRICRHAFSSSFEKCVHDYHHHKGDVCMFSP